MFVALMEMQDFGVSQEGSRYRRSGSLDNSVEGFDVRLKKRC